MKKRKFMGGILGLILVSMAFGAVSSATAAEFHASAPGTALNGTQIASIVMSVQGNEFSCETATVTGSTEGTSSPTQKMAPTYNGCTAFGFEQATVNTEGCKWVLHASDEYDLAGCTAGRITVTISVPLFAKCVAYIPDQTGINGLTYVNQPAHTSLVVGIKSTNIKSEVITSTGLCPLSTGTATWMITGTTKLVPASGEIWVE